MLLLEVGSWVGLDDGRADAKGSALAPPRDVPPLFELVPPKFANMLLVSMLEERLAKGSADDGAGLDSAAGAKGAGFGAPVLKGSVLGAGLELNGGFADGWLNGSLLAIVACAYGGGLLLNGSLRKSSSSVWPLSYVAVGISCYAFDSALNGSSASG